MKVTEILNRAWHNASNGVQSGQPPPGKLDNQNTKGYCFRMDNSLGALALKVEEEEARDEDLELEARGGEELASEEPELSNVPAGDDDLQAHFFQDVGATAMLTPEEEQTLGRSIVRARNRIRRL